ncbi:MAG: ABC transporter permease, partial [Lachnospiraceae bacterium]|nr:ABC transporter permease [Lachnospiraceae bacterium]
MKNPLRKRLLPELKGELGKYLALFVMFTLFIGLISGFLVADGSMIKAYNEGFTKYNIEDGHFRTDKPLNKAQRKNITELGVTIYDLLYVEERMTNDSNMRIYPDRSEVNLVCLMEGELPTGTDEIAVDRMYADNNKLVVGDTLENEEGRIYKISGLVALPDYSCLYEKNSDTMFDAQKFGVAIVSPDAFAGYRSELLYHNYAWKYDDPPQDEKEAKDQNAEFLKEVNDIIHLKDFLARQDNLAITFTGTDMGGDRAMMMILLYMFIGIMAFVFA